MIIDKLVHGDLIISDGNTNGESYALCYENHEYENAFYVPNGTLGIVLCAGLRSGMRDEDTWAYCVFSGLKVLAVKYSRVSKVVIPLWCNSTVQRLTMEPW